MSSTDDSPSALKKVYRTVTPAVREQENVEMDVIGWTIFLGILLLLVPLLPFVAVVYLVTRLLDAFVGDDDDAE